MPAARPHVCMFDDPDPVFGPWYEYLSPLERAVLGVVAAGMALLVWAGLTGPRTDPGVAVAVALFFTGLMAFVVRWSVSTTRSARLTTFDEG